MRHIFLIVIFFGLFGCVESTPEAPKPLGVSHEYTCINGHVYIYTYYSMAPYYEDGSVKRCN